MKNNLSRLVLVGFDILAVYISIVLAYYTRIFFDSLFEISFNQSLIHYTSKLFIYLVILVTFYYEGIYTKRYDFWHESRQVIKSLVLSFLLIMTMLAFTKNIDIYSRFIILFAFLYMTFFIPLFKNIFKKVLFKAGLWQREAKVCGDDTFLKNEVFKNPYLGYIESSNDNVKTTFINSQALTVNELKRNIDKEIRTKHEVIFIPIINDYNMTQSHIYELSNTRTNLVVFRNRLKSRYRVILQNIFNYLLAILALPIFLPLIGVLAYKIKRESSGPVFFVHNRIGKNGKIIPTLKFRSMYSDAKERLEKLLKENEELREEWEKDFKLKDDPRVTKIGAFLRKTSLDELPQIFNVLKGEINLVGPRPVLQEELDMYYKEDAEYYFMVKPGITGLWQVSGRSNTSYDFRVATDKWYVSNWSLWLDIVILLKTIKVVLFRDGAY
jgi:undecaprenyl-phosphate galactose phosphotransferase